MQAATTPVKDFREASVRVLRIDPLMLLATIGLMAASIYTVGTATQDDVANDTPRSDRSGRDAAEAGTRRPTPFRQP